MILQQKNQHKKHDHTTISILLGLDVSFFFPSPENGRQRGGRRHLHRGCGDFGATEGEGIGLGDSEVEKGGWKMMSS